MDRQLIGLIIFISICIVISVFFHRKIKKPILATLYSAFTTTISFQIIAGADPFFIIASIRSFGIAFVIALFVGIPFEYRRRKNKNVDSVVQ